MKIASNSTKETNNIRLMLYFCSFFCLLFYHNHFPMLFAILTTKFHFPPTFHIINGYRSNIILQKSVNVLISVEEILIAIMESKVINIKKIIQNCQIAFKHKQFRCLPTECLFHSILIWTVVSKINPAEGVRE